MNHQHLQKLQKEQAGEQVKCLTNFIFRFMRIILKPSKSAWVDHPLETIGKHLHFRALDKFYTKKAAKSCR